MSTIMYIKNLFCENIYLCVNNVCTKIHSIPISQRAGITIKVKKEEIADIGKPRLLSRWY